MPHLSRSLRPALTVGAHSVARNPRPSRASSLGPSLSPSLPSLSLGPSQPSLNPSPAMRIRPSPIGASSHWRCIGGVSPCPIPPPAPDPSRHGSRMPSPGAGASRKLWGLGVGERRHGPREARPAARPRPRRPCTSPHPSPARRSVDAALGAWGRLRERMRRAPARVSSAT